MYPDIENSSETFYMFENRKSNVCILIRSKGFLNTESEWGDISDEQV